MDSAAYVTYITNLGNAIALYVSGITYSIGFILDIITACIFFCNKNLNKTRMGYQYGMLASIAALSVIANFFLSQFLPNVNPKYSVRLFSDAGCRLGFYLNRVLPHICSWIQMYITFDRYIDLRYPTKFRFLNKHMIMNLIIFIIIVFCLMINVPSLFNSLVKTVTTTVKYYNKTEPIVNGSNMTAIMTITYNITTITTSSSCVGTNWIAFASDIVAASMRSWLPMLLIIIANVLTLLLILESKRRASKGHLNQSSNYKKERQFTISIISMNFIFFMLNFPLSISWVLSDVFKYFAPTTPELTANLNFYNTISILLTNIYSTLTFFILFFFNSVFRREVKKYLGVCFHIGRLRASSSVAHQAATQSSAQRPSESAAVQKMISQSNIIV